MPDAITFEISILEVPLLSHPIMIKMDRDSFGSTIYTGKAGDAYLAAVSMGGHTYIDIPKVFLSLQPTTIMPLFQEVL